MLASGVTHLSEPFFFSFSFPLAVALVFGVSFLLIGTLLFRPGERVLWWGSVLPLSAAILGTANSVVSGYMHPITRWHLSVDLVVGPICIYLMRRSRASRGHLG